jgi:hypothetical protein
MDHEGWADASGFADGDEACRQLHQHDPAQQRMEEGIPRTVKVGINHPRNKGANMRYVHCVMCMKEKPKNKSPGEYSRIDVAICDEGLMVACRRHEKLIVMFTPAMLMEMMGNEPKCDECGDEV